ncbi:MAG: NAD-dependent epimerase/dehydratase family protein, partial [Fimbriimonadaceae bacterium]
MILVVGGAGYIGSHMCRRLAQAGLPFVVFDNLCAGHVEAVSGYDLIQGDLRSELDVR